MIKITEAAADQVKQAIDDTEEGEIKLRLGVSGGGCSGFNYSLDLSNDFDPDNDNISTQHGIDIIVDKKSALFLEEVTLDYEDRGLGERGFVFNNPTARSCGCGKSFNPN